MNWGPQSCFGRFEKPLFCGKKKNQRTTPRSKKKTWQIHEMINQVDHRKGAAPRTAEKSEFRGLGGGSKGRTHAAGDRRKPSLSSQKDQ
jgi:hypothetical protein